MRQKRRGCIAPCVHQDTTLCRAACCRHVLRTPRLYLACRDGLQLHVFPFQPFSDISSRALLQDILDGYHPFQVCTVSSNNLQIAMASCKRTAKLIFITLPDMLAGPSGL